MRARVIAIPFRRDVGQFDDSELLALLEAREAIELREYFYVTSDGLPAMSCFVAWDGPAVEIAPKRAEGTNTRVATKRARPKRGPDVNGAASDDPLDAAGRRVSEALKAWRGQRARELGVPAYRVLTNRQIHALASGRPRSGDDLERIEGIGPRTREVHGAAILDRIVAGGPALARNGESQLAPSRP